MKSWESFEIRVVKALENAGWRCVRSCYITNSGTTSQVDIIAVSNYGVLAVECKSHELDVLMKGKFGDNLIGYKSNTEIFCENVFKQSDTHARQVFLSGVKLEEKLGRTFAPVHSVIVFGHIGKVIRVRKDFVNRIFDKQGLSAEKIIDKLKLYRVYNDDEITTITEYFNQFCDTSQERVEQHVAYIQHCIETKAGMWDEEQNI